MSVQNELSLLRRRGERDLLDACERHDLVILPFFPLASGMLTGKYKRGQPLPENTRLAVRESMANRFFTEHNAAVVEALTAFAEAHGHSILDLAFSWLASRPVVASVIAGATSSKQVWTNANAARWRLGPDDFGEVDRIIEGVTVGR